MPLDLDPTKPVVGKIEIVLYMGDEGIGTAYGLEGVSTEAAIGYLTVVTDRLREERSFEWDTCSECKRPWSEHFEEDDDQPTLYDQEEDE